MKDTKFKVGDIVIVKSGKYHYLLKRGRVEGFSKNKDYGLPKVKVRYFNTWDSSSNVRYEEPYNLRKVETPKIKSCLVKIKMIESRKCGSCFGGNPRCKICDSPEVTKCLSYNRDTIDLHFCSKSCFSKWKKKNKWYDELVGTGGK